MLWTPKKGKLLRETNLGSVGAVAPGTAVSTGGGASTKGTPAQLIASTLFDAYKVKIWAWGYGASGVSSACALDILIGSATEEVIIPNLLAGFCGSMGGGAGKGKHWEFPLYIPAGSRLAVQAAGERVSTSLQVGIELYGGDGYPPWRVGGKVTTYGMGTVPDGTPIAPGVSGAEGAWTQVVASSSEDHFAFVPSFQLTATISSGARALSVDIGAGAAAESEIGGPYQYDTDTTEIMGGHYSGEPAFQDVPAGTRLAMRASSSSTNTGMTFNGVIHAMS
jgi:hypothetical protein